VSETYDITRSVFRALLYLTSHRDINHILTEYAPNSNKHSGHKFKLFFY